MGVAERGNHRSITNSMVKRKAELNLNEWLTSEVKATKPTPAAEAANEECTGVSKGPTVEVQSEVNGGLVTEAHADVAVSE